MDAWTVGLVVVVVLGLAAIVTGALIDRTRNRRAAARVLSAPDRPIPHFDPVQPPRYLSELQARRPPDDAPDLALSAAARQRLEQQLRSPAAVRLSARLASEVFVTDPPTARAVLDDAVVLLCADEIASVRELLPVMERCALTAHPLVVAAPGLASEVLATVEVNRVQRKLLVAVVLTDDRATAMIGELTAASPTVRSDRQAGYFPPGSLGQAVAWVSTRRDTTLLTAADTEPVG